MNEDVKQAEQTEAAAEAAEEVKAEEAKEAEAAEEVKEPEVDPRDEKISALEKDFLRLQADFSNFRRRTAAEKEQLSTYVTANVVGKFLKVLDNFERAEASAAKAKDVESLKKGLEQIRRQFETALKELDVEEIEAMNQKFDANLHEAIMRGQNPELEDETIDMVLEKGYKVRDKVIRPSKVRVINND